LEESDMLRTQLVLIALVFAGTFGCGLHHPRIVHDEAVPKPDDFLFEIQPRVIAPGDAAILHWSIRGTEKVLIEEAPSGASGLTSIGTFAGSGSLEVYPKQDTIYVISCEGSTTYSCASTTVRVRPRSKRSPPR
jgi:hypothetical protein